MQWESPASDGGVGIDSYTLTGAGITVPLTVLSNETLMATLTLSYNELHMVSITASNCAGESTAAAVTILEGKSISSSYTSACVASDYHYYFYHLVLQVCPQIAIPHSAINACDFKSSCCAACQEPIRMITNYIV